MQVDMNNPENQTPEPQTTVPETTVETPKVDSSTQQLVELGNQISYYLEQLPNIITGLFSSYKSALITIGLAFVAILGVKLALAFLDALDDIPLLAPLLELIGLGYVVWFVYRYLLSAASRQELFQDIRNLKANVVGQNGSSKP